MIPSPIRQTIFNLICLSKDVTAEYHEQTPHAIDGYELYGSVASGNGKFRITIDVMACGTTTKFVSVVLHEIEHIRQNHVPVHCEPFRAIPSLDLDSRKESAVESAIDASEIQRWVAQAVGLERILNA